MTKELKINDAVQIQTGLFKNMTGIVQLVSEQQTPKSKIKLLITDPATQTEAYVHIAIEHVTHIPSEPESELTFESQTASHTNKELDILPFDVHSTELDATLKDFLLRIPSQKTKNIYLSNIDDIDERLLPVYNDIWVIKNILVRPVNNNQQIIDVQIQRKITESDKLSNITDTAIFQFIYQYHYDMQANFKQFNKDFDYFIGAFSEEIQRECHNYLKRHPIQIKNEPYEDISFDISTPASFWTEKPWAENYASIKNPYYMLVKELQHTIIREKLFNANQ